jgi:hypothetical protein
MPTIKSLSEYIAEVNKIKTKWVYEDGEDFSPWFRGQASVDYSLLPGLYRGMMDDDLIEDEISYRRGFESKAFPFLAETYGIPSGYWEWYFLMQHYGLPTRLLDWTEGSLIALYFSLFYRSDKDRSNACVWLLNPYGLNKHFHNTAWIFSYRDRIMDKYLWDIFDDLDERRNSLPLSPIAFEPALKSKRIVAQKGCFTMHGKEATPLDQVDGLKGCLYKIEIDHHNIKDIMDEIIMAGISESNLFPELSGLSRELKLYWGREKDERFNKKAF